MKPHNYKHTHQYPTLGTPSPQISVLSSTYSLSTVPAKIVQAPDTLTIEEGQELIITCLIQGLPQPKATWYKAEKVIKPSKKYVIETTSETATLRLPKPTVQDSASYTLKLENPVGKDSATINV